MSRRLAATGLLLWFFASSCLAVETDPWDALAAASAKPAAEAEPALEDLLRRNPGFHAARFNLGTLLIAKDPAKAAEQLQLATGAADPALAADAWHNLALARWKQGRLDEALMAADQAARGNAAYRGLRDELRRVAVARADEARRKAEEEAKKLAIDGTALPEARVGEPYRARIPLRGGTPPIAVALDLPKPAGTTVTLDQSAPLPSPLPPGLGLAPDGTVSGTPATAGSFHVPVVATDAAGGKATGQVSIAVLPQPAIATEALPEAVVGLPYSAPLAAVGLASPRWSATPLPAGLSCGPDAVIRGTPTALGTTQVAVAAEQAVVPPAAPRRAERTLALVVGDSFAPDAPPPPATAGAAYEHRLRVRGPAQEYRWSAPDGQLQVEADGLLHGTPAAEGTVNRPATIHAADGRTRDVALQVTVNPRPLIAVGDPIRLQAGAPADVEIARTGGTPPFAWKIGEGTLPAGVRLDPDGRLRGVAKDPGSYTVTVQLEDRWKARTQASLSLQVDAADPAKDGKPGGKDQAKKEQDKKDQDQKDQQKQDQQADQQKQDGQQKDGQKPTDDQAKHPQDRPKDQAKQDGKPESKPGEPEGAPKPGDKADGKAAAEDQAKQEQQQAASLNAMAADRWLDQLPDEDRGVLRYQLLDGGEKKPEKKGKAW